MKTIIFTLLAKDVYAPHPVSTLVMGTFLLTLINFILIKNKKNEIKT